MTRPSSPEPLPYSAQGDDPRLTSRAVGQAARAMVLSVSVWVVLVLLAMFVTPIFESIFINFKTELPGFTKLVLSMSRWVGRDYGWLLLAPAFFAIPFALLPVFRAQAAAGRQIRWRLMQRLVYTFTMLIVGAYVLAMVLPMASVIETLYGGR
ncbi:MAG TPA: hypothetical protein VGN72_05260 [Tepidisphaeraceae bacterium]|jgi:hypothetical protein|nr:hypothetical protein [Tepidisphaeraceae bacterium]